MSELGSGPATARTDAARIDRAGAMTGPRPAAGSSRSAEMLDIELMCAGAVAAVLVGTQLGRLGHRRHDGAPWQLTTARVNPLLLGLAVAALALVAYLLWRRRRVLGERRDDALLTPIFGPGG